MLVTIVIWQEVNYIWPNHYLIWYIKQLNTAWRLENAVFTESDTTNVDPPQNRTYAYRIINFAIGLPILLRNPIGISIYDLTSI